jgi:TonB-linked SusC/RagA family outer membrane protein
MENNCINMSRKQRLRKLFFILFSSFLFIQISNAQGFQVSGVITSAEDGSAIPGVSVYDKTNGKGVISDIDGRFSISANVGDLIEFSFVGKISQSVKVDNQRSFDVKLKDDVVGMEQVVVVGYGTQKKADFSSSIAVVNSEELSEKPVATFEQALQGISSGVSVSSNRGAPGEGALIRIRGVGTVNNTQPLFVIDGISTEGTSAIDPGDIESVQVLKDAAAAAIYGARGANGVILISTKRGKGGKPKLTFDSYYGVQTAWKQLDLLNAEEYCKLANETTFNDGGKQGPLATRDPFNTKNNTDWQDAMFRPAVIQKYSVSYSGGSEKGNHFISLGYFSQDGIMIGTAYEKYHIRVNNDTKLGKLKFGESVDISFSQKDNESSAGGRSQIEQILKMTPTVAIYDSTALGGFAGPTNDDGHDGVNPVGVVGTHIGKDNVVGIVGNIYGDFEILNGLNFVSRVGVEYSISDYSFLLKAHKMGTTGGVGQTSLENSNRIISSLIFENTLTYIKEFGNHFIKAIVGYTAEERTNKYLMGSRVDFPNNEMTLHGGLSQINNDGQRYESAILSQLARIEYGYANKYLLTANIRRDGSSKFGPNFRWGIFPSVSLAWRISQEEFMKALPSVSDMKLRASYGKIGNQDVGDYAYEASMSNYFRYNFNNLLVTGVGPSVIPNSDIHWETTTMTDIGLDLGMFNNKLYLTTDYYVKKTSEMLVEVPIPGSNGYLDAFPYQNAGSVLNKGFEFSLTYKKYEGKFNYSITGNFAYLHNEVLSIGDGGTPIISGTVETQKSGITKTDVGLPIGSFYLYRTDGLFQTSDAEKDSKGKWVVTNQLYNDVVLPNGTVTKSYMQRSAQPGDIRYKDLDGDKKLTDNDREYAGSPIPKFEYGLSLNASYKGFDFYMFFQGVYGNKIYNETRVWTEGMFGVWNGSTATLDRWREKDITITRKNANGEDVSVTYLANTDTDMPRAITRDPNKNALIGSDRFLEDGSYVRLKTITLGYSLPKSVLSKIKLSGLRIYVTAQNLLTFTKYSGYDPEIGSNPVGDSDGKINLVRGIDNGYYPQPRTILTGIQIEF